MCYVHNQWYDISCAILYVCMYVFMYDCTCSRRASKVMCYVQPLYRHEMTSSLDLVVGHF